nr:hypothetical protein [Tanacetum cinerariifolium]
MGSCGNGGEGAGSEEEYVANGRPEETGIRDLFGGEVSTMMSPRGSIVASFENVESFFVMHTPPDHLIRADLKQKGVVPKIVFHVFEKLVFLLGRHSLNDKVTRVVICKVYKPRGTRITTKSNRTERLERKCFIDLSGRGRFHTVFLIGIGGQPLGSQLLSCQEHRNQTLGSILFGKEIL